MTNNLCTFNRLVAEAMSIEGMSRSQAERAVARKYPEFAPAPQSVASGGASAEQQLDAMAKRIAAERRITYAQAYVEALDGNPELYVQYLREHEAALRASL